jgi:hypothetical protein
MFGSLLGSTWVSPAHRLAKFYWVLISRLGALGRSYCMGFCFSVARFVRLEFSVLVGALGDGGFLDDIGAL